MDPNLNMTGVLIPIAGSGVDSLQAGKSLVTLEKRCVEPMRFLSGNVQLGESEPGCLVAETYGARLVSGLPGFQSHLRSPKAWLFKGSSCGPHKYLFRHYYTSRVSPRELGAHGQIQTAHLAPLPCNHGGQLVPRSDSQEGAGPSLGQNLRLGCPRPSWPALSAPAIHGPFPCSAPSNRYCKRIRARPGGGTAQPGTGGRASRFV